jgi:hypothetical protein
MLWLNSNEEECGWSLEGSHARYKDGGKDILIFGRSAKCFQEGDESMMIFESLQRNVLASNR